MEWKTLTEDDALSGMTQRERDDFAKTSVGITVTDRLLPIIDDLVAEIRGYIATWSPNKISADTTRIPASFKAKAVALLRWRLLTTIPGYTPSEARKLEYEKAEQFLRDVARGTIRPEPADDAIATGVPTETFSPRPRITAREKRFRQSDQEGI